VIVSITTLKVPVIAALLSTIFNDVSQVVASLKSILHLVHGIRLLHLTLYWLSSSILFVTLTLVISVVSKSYLCKLSVIEAVLLG
jgi:hypothetical protein